MKRQCVAHLFGQRSRMRMELKALILLIWLLGDYSVALGYLNAAQRPFWILEDQLTKRQREDRAEADYETTTRSTPRQTRQLQPSSISFVVRQGESPSPSTSQLPLQLPLQRRFMLPHRLQLPHRYVQQRRYAAPPPPPTSKSKSQRRGQSLPIFDGAPGDNAMPMARPGSYPFFVYNSSRGELILNSMLSEQRYPMQEPVPGQILYPPSTPMFRPRPVVERLRLPGRSELLNLTLIPFYAHEAISKAMTTTATTTPAPLSTPAVPVKRKRKGKRKKAKQYNAYHSPHEVQWQPVEPLMTSSYKRRTTAADNHRSFASERIPENNLELDSTEQLEEQLKNDLDYELATELADELATESSSSVTTSSFQIVYMDESLEESATLARPPPASTTATPIRQSSRYALKREYYAFPVFTLGKLLRDPGSSTSTFNSSNNISADTSASSSERQPERDSTTWFIFNSLYKGPHRLQPPGETKYYTSKYIENTIDPD